MSPRAKPGPLAAIVFDFDGTLVDSSGIKRRAYFAAIDVALGVPRADAESAYRAHGTLNRVPQLLNAFRDLAGRDADDSEFDLMVAVYSGFVQSTINDLCLFEGITDLLSRYSEKHCLSVASNAPEKELVATCEAIGIAHFFEGIHGYPTTKESAIRAKQRDCGLAGFQTIYVGDRREDGEVAKRVGVPFLRFGPTEPDDGTYIAREVFEIERFVAAIVPQRMT